MKSQQGVGAEVNHKAAWTVLYSPFFVHSRFIVSVGLCMFYNYSHFPAEETEV